MALTTTGLTNAGVTTHYRFQYDDSLAAPLNPGGPEPARTNAVIQACETDFNLMTGWFGNISLDVNFTIPVNVTQNSGGATWGLSNGNLTVTINPASGNAAFVRYLLISEMVEQFMRAQGRGWYGTGTEGSGGEGLSRFLAGQFFILNGFGNPPTGFTNSNTWLNSPRADFVNNINPTDDGPDAVTGCSTLFLWYLFGQLGFTINQIVAAGASTPAGVYRNLTGDTADPFPFFKRLMDASFPGTSTITSGNLDNPFPLGLLSFWVDKSTFGRDEVTDVIGSASNGTFPNSFWLVLEGFNINKFNTLAIGAPALSGPFDNLPGLSMNLDGSGIQFETLGNTFIPQRIRFPFDIRFANATLASFPTTGNSPVQEVLNASISTGGSPLRGAIASTEFELTAGADPYFTSINPAQNNVFWLSQDLRTFTATPAVNPWPVPGGPTFPSDSVSGAYSYIQRLLAFLNNPANHFTDGSADPFATIPNQAGALAGDSSVSRYTINPFPFKLLNNYNFAIARVRLRGSSGPSGQAQNVKVFFRLWSTQTADTGFDPSSTYLSHIVGDRPRWPLPAPDSHTIPFFATGNTPNLADPNNLEYGPAGVNNQTITIASGDSAWAYFGCFLNVYDPGNVVNGSAVQALLAGTHHCLVGEIADDEAPIVNANGLVASPESSDKLAQRNLQLTFSDNPGPADTHRIPQTFDLKPGRAPISAPGTLLDYPDELMIDWGQTPVGSVAHIYWPQVQAATVLELAGRLYSTHLLSASDGNTIDCTVGRGVAYIPIPPGTTQNIAGLLTVDLPTTVVTGQEFNIVVRRISSRSLGEIAALPTPQIATVVPSSGRARHAKAASIAGPARAAGTQGGGTLETTPLEASAIQRPSVGSRPLTRNWRYVVGTFQIKIPVTTREVMLRPDEDALAVMKWRLQQLTPTSRWYLVLQRYISYVSARVEGLGGDPTAIPPSPDGAPTNEGGPDKEAPFTGGVAEVIYDCCGRFEGFVLTHCCDTRAFATRELAIADVVLRACRDHLLVTVHVEPGREGCIRKLRISAQ